MVPCTCTAPASTAESAFAKAPLVEDLQPHCERKRGVRGDEIAVPAPPPAAVYGPLPAPPPRLDRGERVRHPAPGVVVGVDAHLHVRELPHRAPDDGLE